MDWIVSFMNNATIKADLGADTNVEYASCNMDVNAGFLFAVSSSFDLPPATTISGDVLTG